MRWIASHVFTAVALAGLLQTGTYAQESSEVASLRAEIDALRREIGTSMTTGYDDKKPVAAPATAGGSGCNSCCNTCCNSCCNTCCDSCCNTCCDQGGTCGCFEPCCHCSGVWATAELMWFRYHRADGVRVGGDDDDQAAEFDFEITPRITVGWVGEGGLGARVRYWEFDHSAETNDGNGDNIAVDTYTIDFEVFDTFCLNRNWDLEIAAGIRYNEFLEVMEEEDDERINAFSGFGVVASAELRRLVGTSGALFVRARSAILMDDKDIENDDDIPEQETTLLDVTVGMTELAFGYDFIRPMADGSYAFVRVQAEWQNWYNYTSSFVDTTDNDRFGGPSDVGFGGFGLGLGLVR